jgi:nitrous-oxide reductase
MRVVAAFPSLPEPHDAVFIHRKVLENIVVQTHHPEPNAVKLGEEKVVRNGNKVEVFMTCIRSKFIPEAFEVHEGDDITIHLTNVETIRDMTHGVAFPRHGVNIAVDPGQTTVVPFKAGKPGVYWYYCTWFCSALHLEMRGRMIVKPTSQPLNENPGAVTKEEKVASASVEKKGTSYE